jgi:tetrapyrrole methylase family protein / MazG family protein
MPNKKIIIVGLGAGNPDLLTVGALRVMEQAQTLYLRTAKHPTVPHLPKSLELKSFDAIYDRSESFEEVYRTIAEQLLTFAEKSEEAIIYAVPGHPLVGEVSVTTLLRLAKERGVECEIVAGVSFIEPVLTALELDPLQEGLTILDATEMVIQPEIHLPRDKGLELPVLRPLLIGQLYNQHLASAVKLRLMEYYPDEHAVILLRGAGVPGEEAKLEIPLYELDRYPEWTDHLACVYVPPVPVLQAIGTFAAFQYVVARLRAPGGCPWDREQTHASLRRYLIEETYEVIEAIEEHNDKLPEELGDVLLQVVLHSQLGADEGEFSIRDVLQEITEKMIRRHPHVFGEVQVNSAGEVTQNWEEIKKAERNSKGEKRKSVLDGVPKHEPALLQAQNLQRKAAGLGFEWRNYSEIIDKLVEEVTELHNATDYDNLVEEFGDVLAVLANAARFMKVDAEEALRKANQKFRKRFGKWEEIVETRQLEPRKMELPELVDLWNEARSLTEVGGRNQKSEVNRGNG